MFYRDKEKMINFAVMKIVPLKFRPYYKRTIWGGTEIARFKGETSDHEDVGESWELSALPNGESTVAEGPYAGYPLSRLIEEFGELLLGVRSIKLYGKTFPLLVKLIDANDNLSVQVHPDDSLAARRHGCKGKTEMWYIISTRPGAKIYSGLNRAMTREEYVKSVNEGTFAEYVAAHDSAPGDVFFLPAGQVHAIGSGNLLAEIQQPSDITYRIFDYNRVDAEGNSRELHTEQALDAIDFSGKGEGRRKADSFPEGDASLVECEFFKVRRLRVDGERQLPLEADDFIILICVEGVAAIALEGGEVKMRAGQTVLIPAAAKRLTLGGHATLLTATL